MAVSDWSNLSSEAKKATKRYYGITYAYAFLRHIYKHMEKRKQAKQRERDKSRCQETSVDLKSSNKKLDHSYWGKNECINNE